MCIGCLSSYHWYNTCYTILCEEPHLRHGLLVLVYQGRCQVSNRLRPDLCAGDARSISSGNLETADSEQRLRQDAFTDLSQYKDRSLNIDSSKGRVMLIDGTSIIYRAYYKLLGI